MFGNHDTVSKLLAFRYLNCNQNSLIAIYLKSSKKSFCSSINSRRCLFINIVIEDGETIKFLNYSFGLDKKLDQVNLFKQVLFRIERDCLKDIFGFLRLTNLDEVTIRNSIYGFIVSRGNLRSQTIRIVLPYAFNIEFRFKYFYPNNCYIAVVTLFVDRKHYGWRNGKPLPKFI